jgi:hypothetical protein
MSNHGLLERAFALAESESIRSLNDLRQALREEGYTHYQLTQFAGSGLAKQLSSKIRAGMAVRPAGADAPGNVQRS